MLIRPAVLVDAETIARVRVETWRSAYRELMPDGVLARLDVAADAVRWSENLASLPSERFVFVAGGQDGVVGFAAGGPLREPGEPLPGAPAEVVYTGELMALYVLPDFHGQGIGRALLQAAAAWLARAGHRGMLIWTLAGNAPARRFYEAQGGLLARQMRNQIGGVWMEEVGYGYALGETRGVKRET